MDGERQEPKVPAEIVGLEDDTPTVKRVTLQLDRCGTFELAARVGDRVAVRVGGCFHYEPGDEARPLLLLHVTGPEWRGREAEWGGRWDRIRRHDLAASLHWLQASTTSSEDVSDDDGGASLDAAAAAAATAESAATAASWPGGFNSGSCSACGGVGEGARVGSCEVAALLCGPSGMEDAMLADLLSLGLRPGQIRHERWW
ncbi:hypothetical protein ABPG77_004265 [Micractinium sp. CCAP 211/92]